MSNVRELYNLKLRRCKLNIKYFDDRISTLSRELKKLNKFKHKFDSENSTAILKNNELDYCNQCYNDAIEEKIFLERFSHKEEEFLRALIKEYAKLFEMVIDKPETCFSELEIKYFSGKCSRDEYVEFLVKKEKNKLETNQVDYLINALKKLETPLISSFDLANEIVNSEYFKCVENNYKNEPEKFDEFLFKIAEDVKNCKVPIKFLARFKILRETKKNVKIKNEKESFFDIEK